MRATIVALLMVAVALGDLTPEEKRWTRQCLVGLNSKNGRVREACARAIEAFGVDAIPSIVKDAGTLRSDEAWAALAEALANVGRAEVAAALRQAESSWPKASRRRLEALLASLAPAGGKGAGAYPRPNAGILQEVRELLAKFRGANRYSSDDPKVARIVNLGHPAAAALIQVLREQGESHSMLVSAASDALREVVKETDRPYIGRLLNEGVLAAAKCLERIPGDASLDLLVRTLRSGRSNHDVLGALEYYKDRPRTKKAVVEYLQRFGKSGDFEAGYTAEFAGEIRAYDAVPILERMIAVSSETSFRRGVATGLVDLGSKRGIPILIDIVNTTGSFGDRYHRHEAGETLNKIVGRRIYIGSYATKAKGNFDEAAAKFRKWYAANKPKLQFDRATGRWSVR